MKIRIVNTDENAATKHTKVYTESGEEITGCIQSLTIHIGNDWGTIKADMKMVRVSVDILAELGIVTVDGKQTENVS